MYKVPLPPNVYSQALPMMLTSLDTKPVIDGDFV